MKAIRDHIDNEDKLTERIVLSGQKRQAILINKSGLYALILSSKQESAKRFKQGVGQHNCLTLTQIAKNGTGLPLPMDNNEKERYIP